MWKDNLTLPSYPSLSTDTTVDVAIAGAGITGLTAAYLLAQGGKKVVVLEQGRLEETVTSVTTGFLTQVIDTDLGDAIAIWGKETMKEILAGHKKSIDMIEQVVTKEDIPCEFTRCSNYIYAREPTDQLTEKYAAAHELGLSALLTKTPVFGFTTHTTIEIQNQAKIHPMKYLSALAKRTVDYGAEIYEDTKVTHVTDGNTLHTKDATVKASHIFFATHKAFHQPLGLFFRKGTYISHVLELEIPHGAIPEGTYEDTANPYHYFRVDALKGKEPGTDRMILGGEDHRKDIPVPHTKCIAALKAFAKETFGHLEYRVVDEWDGPILEPSDGLPFIGPYKYDSTFYASGFSGNGLTYGTLSALMFADHVEGRSNPWQKIFDPRRVPYGKGLLYKGRDYAEEFFGGAVKNLFRRQ